MLDNTIPPGNKYEVRDLIQFGQRSFQPCVCICSEEQSRLTFISVNYWLPNATIQYYMTDASVTIYPIYLMNNRQMS